MTHVMTRPTTMNDDHGDQFPGAVPAPPAAAPPRTGEPHVRMRAAYVHKVNSAVQAGRDGLAHELARTFAAETTAPPVPGDPTHRATGRRSQARTHGGRPPGQATSRLGRMGRLTRRSLKRFDRYTLDVFNPGAPDR
jgi:hypothetical protein